MIYDNQDTAVGGVCVGVCEQQTYLETQSRAMLISNNLLNFFPHSYGILANLVSLGCQQKGLMSEGTFCKMSCMSSVEYSSH